MGKIIDYFNSDKYLVFFGHDMPEEGYKYIEDYDEEVTPEFFAALFKLFILSKNEESDEYYNTFEGVNFFFDDEFGCYDNDDYNDFIDSLDEKDICLTKKEATLLKKYLTNLIDDIVSFEEEEYDPDYADSDIEDAIENKSFVIFLSTHSLL